MSVNSTAAGVLADAPHASSASLSDLVLPTRHCSNSTTATFILTTFSITNIFLLLPLNVLILNLGCRRRRRLRPVSSSTDLVTYHSVAMETVAVSGCLLFCVGMYAGLDDLMVDSFELSFSTWCVKISFHSLTCVEHYLAVVHPVAYLGLKSEAGVRIRNASLGCVWLLCFLWASLAILTGSLVKTVLYFCVTPLNLMVICFCGLAVLGALRRPGPDGRQVDRTKRRAFHNIMTITGVLLLSLGGMLVCGAVGVSLPHSVHVGCAVMVSVVWFGLPSTVVLPLLFLHRVGKLPGCKRSSESGRARGKTSGTR